MVERIKKNPIEIITSLVSGLVAGAGLVLTLVLSGILVPPALRQVEAQVRVNTINIETIQGQYEKIICLLTLPDGTTPIEGEQLCGVEGSHR